MEVFPSRVGREKEKGGEVLERSIEGWVRRKRKRDGKLKGFFRVKGEGARRSVKEGKVDGRSVV